VAILCLDVYGTLCDPTTVTDRLGRVLDLPADLAGSVSASWRRTQLRYSFLVALMDDYRPFRAVTAAALDRALALYALDPPAAARDRLVDGYDALDPFPEVVPALERLGEDHTLAVLSNGDPESLARLAADAGLEAHLDAVYSADAVGTFKPSPAVYRHAADELGVDPGACTLVSSNAWDAAGAGAAGMKTAWVNRHREPFETVGPTPGLTVDSLAALADAL
jgi:2-haloacid dehalogenase